MAVDAGVVIGHILFTDVTIRRPNGERRSALALPPLAVIPERQRTGIGSRLTVAGLAACRDRGDRLVVVVGHADFYPRFGFRSARSRGFMVPFPVEDASFLVCDLASEDPEAVEMIGGMIEYPAPFLSV